MIQSRLGACRAASRGSGLGLDSEAVSCETWGRWHIILFAHMKGLEIRDPERFLSWVSSESQWKAVPRRWAAPDWDKNGKFADQGGVQAGFVRQWARAFRWDKEGLVECAKVPKRLKERSEYLYIDALRMNNWSAFLRAIPDL